MKAEHPALAEHNSWMIHKLSSKVIFLLVLLCCRSVHAGEDEQTVRRLWANFGLGLLKSSEEQADLSRLLSLSYQHDWHLFTLRYMVASNDLGCEGVGDCKEFKDISLLYGFSSRGQKIHASISIGGGLASIQEGHAIDESFNETEKTFGLALATQVFWRPIKALGIGLYGLGNINPERDLFGGMLSIQLFGNL
ncbi:MAG: hypothetical protein GWN00_31950 [Aliifodinibius sp.]|nr:hypothetical protein [Fodinibius sp.]NIV15373.1 hypothetical protein [Fodinibius sp.]NIY29233.1 hypothetical protein [Fodinibius sp.]